jgi:hypothetical protein
LRDRLSYFFTPDLEVKSVDAEPIEDDDDHLRKNRFIPLGSAVGFRVGSRISQLSRNIATEAAADMLTRRKPMSLRRM